MYTEVFVNLLENFKKTHDKEVNYYLGLLIIQHFKDKKKNVSKDPNSDYNFVNNKLALFALKHQNKKNGDLGTGAAVFLLAVLDPESTNPDDFSLKEFETVKFDKITSVNEEYVINYIRENLNLTREEYAVMQAKYALSGPLKILHKLDEIFGKIFKQPIYMMTDLSFKVAPEKTSNYIIKKVSNENFNEQTSNAISTAIGVTENLSKNYLGIDLQKKKHDLVKRKVKETIHKADAKPSTLVRKASSATLEKSKQMASGAKSKTATVSKEIRQVRRRKKDVTSTTKSRKPRGL